MRLAIDEPIVKACVIIAIIVSIAALMFKVFIFDPKQAQQNQSNICIAICGGNDVAIGCDHINHSLRVICMAPKSKVARIVEVQQ